MSIIYLLLTVSIFVAVVFFIAFVISVKNGQYDDTYTPAVRMLFEDEPLSPDSRSQEKKSTKNTSTTTKAKS